MKKEEIISITEGLPLSIGRYKLYIYEDNGELWLGETNFGKLPDCLTTILDKLVRYQERS